MIKIFILFLIILLAVDGIFQDGFLVEVFFSREMHLPFFAKILYIIIGFSASILLLHTIISEFALEPKPEEKKTAFQILKEQEEEEERKRIEEEEAKKDLEDKKVKDLSENSNRKYLL